MWNILFHVIYMWIFSHMINSDVLFFCKLWYCWNKCKIDTLSLKGRKLLTLDLFWCPVHRETTKIKVPILYFWSKASAPTQETQHSEGSVYIGNASICAPTSSIFLSRSCVSLTCSLALSSPLALVFLFSPAFSFSSSVWSLSLFFEFSLHLPPTRLPLLCIPQYPPDRESFIFIGETHVLFWQ